MVEGVVSAPWLRRPLAQRLDISLARGSSARVQRSDGLVYAVYILVADRAGLTLEPIALTALVCAGAACTFALAAAVSGTLGQQITLEGWLSIDLMTLVSTALPIVAFFAGLARIGPSSAAIITSLDPVVTVVLAYLVFRGGAERRAVNRRSARARGRRHDRVADTQCAPCTARLTRNRNPDQPFSSTDLDG